MTPTKKQIAEVTEAAIQAGVPVENALKSLSLVSASMYKVMGAKGVVDATAKTIDRSQGVCLMSDCSIEKETEKAYLVKYIGQTLAPKTFWIAKSLITNGTFPIWVADKN